MKERKRERKKDRAIERLKREGEKWRRVCTSDRERGRKIAGVWGTQIECVWRDEEAVGEGEEVRRRT